MYVDEVKLAGRKQNIDPMWKALLKEVDFGKANIIPWPRLFGLHSTEMRHEQRYCGQLQKYVWIQDLCRSKRKATLFRETDADISSWSYDMEGHAKKCVERYCELANRTTQQLYKVSLMNISSKKKNWNPWEICQTYALKLFWNAYTWHVLEDLIFYGQWTNLHDPLQNGPKLVTND